MTDTLVVGSGPNGLAAAIELARAGRRVVVHEAQDTIGGGLRSSELTLPGFVHDHCSAFHPLAMASPFFRSLGLGVEWVHPDAPLAHPFDDGSAAMLERSVEATAHGLGTDRDAYRRLMRPLVRDADGLVEGVLRPVLGVPSHPATLARFGLRGIRSVRSLASSVFTGERAKALLAGSAAHSLLPLTARPTGGFALLLTTLGHAHGWPVARGGSQEIADALVSVLRSLGGDVLTGRPLDSLGDVDASVAQVLMDVTPRQLVTIGGRFLPERYARALRRFRYGPGVFKVDWALDGPVPWKASECLRAGTVHLGGTIEEISASEHAVNTGDVPERPFVIAGQQSLFDRTRAPDSKQTLWAYCHVPHGSPVDMTERIESQIERFAPGFRDRVLARHTMSAPEVERRNASLVGGDINGGAQDVWQHVARPVLRIDPYATPVPGLFLCGQSTPPGGGVHGMCGVHAARSALRRQTGYVSAARAR